MLFVDVEESVAARKDDDAGVLFKESMSGAIGRVKEASVFVLDANAVTMGINVWLGRPSSIIAALPFVRLPSPTVWIEFSNFAARDALASFGNDNQNLDGSVTIEKTGFLLTEKDGKIKMEMIAQYASADRIKHIELLSAICDFDIADDFSFEHLPLPIVAGNIKGDATGKAAKYYNMLARDDSELKAQREIKERFSGSTHPDFRPIMQKMSSVMSDDKLDGILQGHISDMKRLFTMQILPTLILLNCRNAVDTEHVAAPEKLNKTRRKKKRPEIGDYKLVKLHLNPQKRKIYEGSGATRQQTEGGLVIGHFKVRKSGVYWWSPFWRGPLDSKGARRVNVITT